MSNQVPFSDLVEINPPRSISLPKTDCEVSFIPMQDVSDNGGWSNRQTRHLSAIGNGYTAFEEDDVLFAKITPCMENGKGTHAIGLKNGIGFGSTEFHVLRAKDENLSRFVFHWCNSKELRQAAEIQMTGSAGQKRVPADFFSRFLVTRIDANQQKSIATILDSIDDTIHQTKATIAKLRQVKAGMLHDLLTRGLDENSELRDPIRHPEQFKDSPLGRFPKNWQIKGLLEAAKIAEGQVDPKIPPFIDYPLVAPDHVESTTGRLLSLKTARDQGAISGKYHFLPNDVIYCKIRPYLRKVWLSSIEGLCSADMYPFRPSIDLDSYFLYTTLLSERFSLFAISVSERSGFPKINRTELSCFQIALPPLGEQKTISNAIKSIEKKIETEETVKVKLRSLKQGLMHDLLTGKVRVPEKLLEAPP